VKEASRLLRKSIITIETEDINLGNIHTVEKAEEAAAPDDEQQQQQQQQQV
jgi:hypothetical protein